MKLPNFLIGRQAAKSFISKASGYKMKLLWLIEWLRFIDCPVLGLFECKERRLTFHYIGVRGFVLTRARRTSPQEVRPRPRVFGS